MVKRNAGCVIPITMCLIFNIDCFTFFVVAAYEYVMESFKGQKKKRHRGVNNTPPPSAQTANGRSPAIAKRNNTPLKCEVISLDNAHPSPKLFEPKRANVKKQNVAAKEAASRDINKEFFIIDVDGAEGEDLPTIAEDVSIIEPPIKVTNILMLLKLCSLLIISLQGHRIRHRFDLLLIVS